jgi:Transposase DNA-binding/Transposase Tn5 dimerisation domain
MCHPVWPAIHALLFAPLPKQVVAQTALLDAQEWAECHFQDAQLGDVRRTRRLIHFAAQAAEHPAGSIPQQTQDWSDAKATYNLLDNARVTFQAVASPHWQHTRDCPPGRYLILEDTTEVAWRKGRLVEDTAPLGNGSGHGFLLHSALLVSAATDDVHGLAAQTIHYRQAKPAHENDSQRVKRQRESQVWLTVIDQIGMPPVGVQWIHVLDRGGDNFEVFCKVRQNQTDCVVRAAVLSRIIVNPEDQRQSLRDYLATLSVAGCYDLALRSRPQQAARTARIAVSYGTVQMPRPRFCSAWAKEEEPLPLAVVQAREVDGPAKGAIAWVLYTTLPVTDLAEAMTVIAAYEKRWQIEEWHKALKSGCQLERRQLKKARRVEALVGILGVVAVRLLQLRSVARSLPERAAAEVVPQLYILVLKRARGIPAGQHWTVQRFFRELAKLGGFLGRKGDGEPGWQTIWRGWEQLVLLLRGYELGRAAAASETNQSD